MTDELQSTLERAAAFIIEKSARETTSGNYIIGADDIPADILSPELFAQHITEIASIMEEYDAVADVGFTSREEIDILLYLDYCPNFEPDSDEQDIYPPDRKILDPLASKRVPQKEDAPPKQPASKPSLLDTLERNKQKVARQGQSSVRKSSEMEV